MLDGGKDLTFFLKMANRSLFFRLFASFQHVTIQIQIEKSVDGVLGIWTQGSRMEGANESTELWRHPKEFNFYSKPKDEVKPVYTNAFSFDGLPF